MLNFNNGLKALCVASLVATTACGTAQEDKDVTKVVIITLLVAGAATAIGIAAAEATDPY